MGCSVSYNLHDVVEYPTDSGHFWQSTTAGPTAAPNATGKWLGPCSCEEIAEASGIVWNSTVAYNPWQIVEYNGAIWFVQDAVPMRRCATGWFRPVGSL